MANFMTDFKPTGGDWLSAIAKVLGSSSEFAGSMEKRKKDELFRKALAEMGNKEGWLPETQEDVNAIPQEYSPRNITVGPRLDERGYPQGYPENIKDFNSSGNSPVNYGAKEGSPFQKQLTVGMGQGQYPKKLQDTSIDRYSKMDDDALLKLYAMRNIEQPEKEDKYRPGSVNMALKELEMVNGQINSIYQNQKLYGGNPSAEKNLTELQERQKELTGQVFNNEWGTQTYGQGAIEKQTSNRTTQEESMLVSQNQTLFDKWAKLQEKKGTLPMDINAHNFAMLLNANKDINKLNNEIDSALQIEKLKRK